MGQQMAHGDFVAVAPFEVGQVLAHRLVRVDPLAIDQDPDRRGGSHGLG